MHFNLSKALVQKEQVTDELGRVRQRFEDHVKESQTLIRAERDSARRENQALVDDLNEKVSTLLFDIALPLHCHMGWQVVKNAD